MIRAFIALPLPDDVKDGLVQASLNLKRTIDARWVRPDAMHLTLKFLGDIEEKHVAELSSGLDRILSGQPPFNMSLSGLGAFPSSRRARVIWAGIATDISRMKMLAADIDRLTARLGVRAETRPFAAHITLARLKVPSMVNLDCNVPEINFISRAINLYKSDLSPQGARHTVLHTSPFMGIPGG
jgi:2'-5' RNA ligase